MHNKFQVHESRITKSLNLKGKTAYGFVYDVMVIVLNDI